MHWSWSWIERTHESSAETDAPRPRVPPALRTCLFSAAAAISLGVATLAYLGIEETWPAVGWFASLLAFAVAAWDRPSEARRKASPLARALLLLAVAGLPVLVRLVHLGATRMHQGEFQTAYFSATHDFGGSSFFGYMPKKSDWLAQFPKPFFFLQRLFFTLFGASLFTIRLSVQVYVAVVSVMLFLIVRELLDLAAALVAVVLYSFLAVSVYLETLGLMFISSTAVFLVFSYFVLRELRSGRSFDAAMTGIACGCCYLTYYSSYIALPVLMAFMISRLFLAKKAPLSRNLIFALGGVFLALAPFVAWVCASETTCPGTGARFHSSSAPGPHTGRRS